MRDIINNASMKAWGYHQNTDTLVPLQVNVDGKLAIHPTVIINIGCAAINRDDAYASGWTRINKGNPANDHGTIDTVEIWAHSDLSGCKIGIFYTTNGNTLKCRSTATIGNVTAGSKQIFTGLSLVVQTGDYIGMFWTSGTVDAEIWTADGLWMIEGDHCVVDDETIYTFSSSANISTYGTGER